MDRRSATCAIPARAGQVRRRSGIHPRLLALVGTPRTLSRPCGLGAKTANGDHQHGNLEKFRRDSARAIARALLFKRCDARTIARLAARGLRWRAPASIQLLRQNSKARMAERGAISRVEAEVLLAVIVEVGATTPSLKGDGRARHSALFDREWSGSSSRTRCGRSTRRCR